MKTTHLQNTLSLVSLFDVPGLMPGFSPFSAFQKYVVFHFRQWEYKGRFVSSLNLLILPDFFSCQSRILLEALCLWLALRKITEKQASCLPSV
jgi:hypothetical protein